VATLVSNYVTEHRNARKLVTCFKVNMAALNVLAPVIEWLGSQKGKEKLIIDGYSFTNKGKGKAANAPNVRYWACETNGCAVKAKTDGNLLLTLTGLNNPPDHGHPNNIQQVADLKLKVGPNLQQY
jgi:hypothetical protein